MEPKINESYDNEGSMAQELAIKIIMKKKQDQGMNRNVSEDELRRQVIKEMKGDVN